MIRSSILAGALGLAFSGSPAFADEQHGGDIQPFLANGSIGLNATLFEGDFGDLAGGAFRTDDPGYDVDEALGAFTPGNWLQIEGLGVLQFWNGSSWGAPVANETVRLTGALGDDTIFSASGVSNPFGVIDLIDSEGGVHAHLDMAVRTSGGSLGGTVGAYAISLRLLETAPDSTTALHLSDSFTIVLNRGLAFADFEAAVEALAAPVPLPAAVYLMGGALLGLGGMRRRARR